MSPAFVSRLRRWLSLWLLLGGLTLVAPPLRAQDTPFENGTHALRRILHDSGFQPLQSWTDLDDIEAPPRTLLVLLGEPPGRKMEELLEQIPGKLRSFVEQGGAVLLATDQPLFDLGTVRERKATPGTDAVIKLTGCITGFYHVTAEQKNYHDLPDC